MTTPVASVRLPGYDYRREGAYFITVCAHTRSRTEPFGRIVRGAPELTAMGQVVEACWLEIPDHFPFVALDAFVVMPDHLHGIVIIGEAMPVRAGHAGPPRVGATHATDGGATHPTDVGATHPTDVGATHASPLPVPAPPRGPAPGSIPAIVGSFKSAAARRVNLLRGTPEEPVWQRNYHEHIIRNTRALRRIRRYIAENPGRWLAEPAGHWGPEP